MNAEFKRAWLDALRSGKYTQGKGNLRPSTDCMCALGVLADIYCVQYPEQFVWYTADGLGIYYVWDKKRQLSERYDAPFVDMPAADRATIQVMNDEQGKSFSEIADWIETNIKAE